MVTKLFLLLFTTTFLYSYPTYSKAVKEKKIYSMGKKIYSKLCTKITPMNYSSYEEMQSEIVSKKMCKNLNEKYLQALSLYLWDVERVATEIKVYEKLTVTKKEKCPVCGMFLYKYPTWISRIKYQNESFSFDGIKDMMKYYFEYNDSIVEILVQDYYSAKTIDAKEAFYVIGSDVYGPMGYELIAFKDEDAAKRFMLDHRGKEVLRFEEITPKIIQSLDE